LAFFQTLQFFLFYVKFTTKSPIAKRAVSPVAIVFGAVNVPYTNMFPAVIASEIKKSVIIPQFPVACANVKTMALVTIPGADPLATAQLVLLFVKVMRAYAIATGSVIPPPAAVVVLVEIPRYKVAGDVNAVAPNK
jgi:hypothetical protein